MTALVGAWLSLSDVVSGPTVLATLASLGMLGGILGTDFFGLFGGGDESDESDDGSTDDDDDLFGDDFDDGEDGWDDGFGGMDDFGGMNDNTDESLDELTLRVDELETEVATISSSMSTVRSENEQISESLDDVEGNVRSLLDIYEMVTRGVNPFVDDVQEDASGSFGLFDNDDSDDSASEVGEEVANADAESFFDDDFDDGADDSDFGDDFMDDDFADDDFDDESFDDMDDTDDGDSGMSFKELKEEYDSGEANWDDDEEDADESDVVEDETFAAVDDGDAFADAAFDETGVDETGDADGTFATDVADESTGGALDVDPVAGTDGEPAADDPSGSDVVETDAVGADADEDDDTETEDADDEPPRKPYLTELPDGYLADLVVLEWLEFLVTEGGTATAIDAIRYYGDIEWIGPAVEDELTTYITGFSAIEPEATGPLSIRQHKESLIYVCQLAEGVSESPPERSAPRTSPPVARSTTASNGRTDVRLPDGGTDGI